MLRLGSHGCVLALFGMPAMLGMLGMLACNKTDAGTSAIGSPNASAAGNEAAKPGSHVAGASKTGNADALVRSLVAVAATSSGEAQPCERTCGRVGDCLLEGSDVGEFEAGRLELQCLDACVHSPESDASRSAFLGCEQQSGCGELLGCARSNWDALVAARLGPAVQGIVSSGDDCVDSCQWMYSCIFSGLPPGQASLAPEYEELIRSCDTMCETMSPGDREIYASVGGCMRDRCGQNPDSCWENLY